jgi:hypothetical protein
VAEEICCREPEMGDIGTRIEARMSVHAIIRREAKRIGVNLVGNIQS